MLKNLIDDVAKGKDPNVGSDIKVNLNALQTVSGGDKGRNTLKTTAPRHTMKHTISP